jgi:hypothetical protein
MAGAPSCAHTTVGLYPSLHNARVKVFREPAAPVLGSAAHARERRKSEQHAAPGKPLCHDGYKPCVVQENDAAPTMPDSR